MNGMNRSRLFIFLAYFTLVAFFPPTGLEANPDPPTASDRGTKVVPADGRGKADYYFEGYYSKTSDGNEVFGTDIKIKPTYWWITPVWGVGPSMEILQDSRKEGNADRIAVGIAARGPLWVPLQANPVFNGIYFVPTLAYETNRKRETADIKVDVMTFWDFPWMSKGGRKAPFRYYVRPYLGYEFGRHMRRQEETQSDSTVSRVFAKAEGMLKWELGDHIIRSIAIDGRYEYRKDTNAGGTTHTYGKVQLLLGLTNITALSCGYEGGELPPAFNKVRDKVTVKIVVAFSVE
jgi:hypothetical protein